MNRAMRVVSLLGGRKGGRMPRIPKGRLHRAMRAESLPARRPGTPAGGEQGARAQTLRGNHLPGLRTADWPDARTKDRDLTARVIKTLCLRTVAWAATMVGQLPVGARGMRIPTPLI